MPSVQGYLQVLLEGDALQVVKVMQKEEPDNSVIGGLIENSRVIMQSFNASKTSHVSQQANGAAHQSIFWTFRVVRGNLTLVWCFKFGSVI